MLDTGQPRQYRRLDPRDTPDMVDQYHAGASIRAIATAWGISYGAAYRALHALGADIRPRGRAKGRKAGSGDLRAESGATGTEAGA